jgi:hypothetical protein
MTASAPSFANDIAPMFYKFRSQMRWRLDLASYDDVKASAPAIYAQIYYEQGQEPGMPPTPYPPYTQDQVALFKAWMDAGCPA